MSTATIEIHAIYMSEGDCGGGGDLWAFMAPGRHDPDGFLEALRAYARAEYSDVDGSWDGRYERRLVEEAGPEKVAHEVWVSVPGARYYAALEQLDESEVDWLEDDRCEMWVDVQMARGEKIRIDDLKPVEVTVLHGEAA